VVTLQWPAISNRTYRVQYKANFSTTNWTDVAGDITATGTNASKSDTPGITNRFYRVVLLP
jgi:hypothetical protein